jgi:hypothetical protein
VRIKAVGKIQLVGKEKDCLDDVFLKLRDKGNLVKLKLCRS